MEKPQIKYTHKFRLKVVKFALKNKITEAAALYGVNRVVISRWVKRYRENGEEGLKNSSRHGMKHPLKKNKSMEVLICQLKKKNPEITLKTISEHPNVDCSIPTIAKKLKQNGLLETKKKKLVKKNKLQKFYRLYIDEIKQTFNDSDIPKYIKYDYKNSEILFINNKKIKEHLVDKYDENFTVTNWFTRLTGKILTSLNILDPKIRHAYKRKSKLTYPKNIRYQIFNRTVNNEIVLFEEKK